MYLRPYVYSFCQIFPGPMFLPCPTSIPEARIDDMVHRLYILEYIFRWTNDKVAPGAFSVSVKGSPKSPIVTFLLSSKKL